ncbi:MAG: N-6 DNA methylase [Allosphingosinicella sp.]
MADENFDALLQGLDNTRRRLSGEDVPDFRVHFPTVGDVATIRKETGLSQAPFTCQNGAEVATLRNWEQDHRWPDDAIPVLLPLAAQKPGRSGLIAAAGWRTTSWLTKPTLTGMSATNTGQSAEGRQGHGESYGDRNKGTRYTHQICRPALCPRSQDRDSDDAIREAAGQEAAAIRRSGGHAVKNERVTEDFVRDHFKNDPLFNAVRFDEQRASVAKARTCLAKASKSLTGKIGSPEFIISFPALPDDIIVVECKADPKFHRSDTGQNPTAYAVDGALHYSTFLSKEYNVTSIAVSGDKKGKLKVSSFHQKMGELEVTEGAPDLLDIFSYITLFKGETQAQSIESAEITKTAIELNKELNDYSIVEYERCTLVSAILLALQNAAFKASYKEQATSKNLEPTPERLADFIVTSINNVLKDADIDSGRVSSMIGEYEKIKNHSIAKSPRIKKKKASEQQDNYVLRDITERLQKTVLPLITLGDKGYDVLGRFYREFIRYAGTDKKTGLVLTPQHITEFFCDVVSLNANDVTFDSCCGSGGFLISAMKHMLEKAGPDQKMRRGIKENQLLGIERRTDMFTFACSNMMMSGDGKSHIYQGDSFANEIVELIRGLKPTVAFLNPPYDVGEDGQLEFIENALNCLQPSGRCAAIVQMSCATSSSAKTVTVRERLLAKHTLAGVFSMPDDLFHPVGVITCIMVFDAHKPHPKGFKTFFGYFKDDGFRKTKHMGRINKGGWEQIRAQWLDTYWNREKVGGLSVLQSVSARDEWCAEAYMETDYSKITQADFIKAVRDYAIHKLTLETL